MRSALCRMAQSLAQREGLVARIKLGEDAGRLGTLSVQRSGMGFVEVIVDAG